MPSLVIASNNNNYTSTTNTTTNAAVVMLSSNHTNAGPSRFNDGVTPHNSNATSVLTNSYNVHNSNFMPIKR